MELILEKRKIKVEKNKHENAHTLYMKYLQIANFDHKNLYFSDNENVDFVLIYKIFPEILERV